MEELYYQLERTRYVHKAFKVRLCKWMDHWTWLSGVVKKIQRVKYYINSRNSCAPPQFGENYYS